MGRDLFADEPLPQQGPESQGRDLFAGQPPLEELRDLSIQRSKLPRGDTSLDERIFQLRAETNQPDTDTGEAAGATPTDINKKGVLGSLGQ